MEKIPSGKSTKRVYVTKTPHQTQRLAEDFSTRLILDQGSTLTHATVLALYGELGSGKTTFVQGLAQGLGVAQRIISPTFVIVRSYGIRNQESGIRNFYHIDLYRIESQEDLKGLGIEEILNNRQNLVAIEWAERLGNWLPQERIDIRFDYIDEEKRRITIEIRY